MRARLHVPLTSAFNDQRPFFACVRAAFFRGRTPFAPFVTGFSLRGRRSRRSASPLRDQPLQRLLPDSSSKLPEFPAPLMRHASAANAYAKAACRGASLACTFRGTLLRFGRCRRGSEEACRRPRAVLREPDRDRLAPSSARRASPPRMCSDLFADEFSRLRRRALAATSASCRDYQFSWIQEFRRSARPRWPRRRPERRDAGEEGHCRRSRIPQGGAFFSPLSTTANRAFSPRGSTGHFKAGTDIFRFGDPGDIMRQSSQARSSIAFHNPTGEKIDLATARAGDFFGEMSMLDNGPRMATAKALEDVTALVVDRGDIDAFVHTKPEAAMDLLTATGKRLRRSSRLSATPRRGHQRGDGGQAKRRHAHRRLDRGVQRKHPLPLHPRRDLHRVDRPQHRTAHRRRPSAASTRSPTDF